MFSVVLLLLVLHSDKRPCLLFAGVDDVFVFINTFRQANHMLDLGERMYYTVRTAGKATFFTSFTTAAAFAANVASAVSRVSRNAGGSVSTHVKGLRRLLASATPPSSKKEGDISFGGDSGPCSVRFEEGGRGGVLFLGCTVASAALWSHVRVIIIIVEDAPAL